MVKKIALALACFALALPVNAAPEMTKDQAYNFLKYHDYLNKEFRLMDGSLYGHKYINENRKLEIFLLLDKSQNVFMDSVQLTELSPED